MVDVTSYEQIGTNFASDPMHTNEVWNSVLNQIIGIMGDLHSVVTISGIPCLVKLLVVHHKDARSLFGIRSLSRGYSGTMFFSKMVVI